MACKFGLSKLLYIWSSWVISADQCLMGSYLPNQPLNCWFDWLLFYLLFVAIPLLSWLLWCESFPLYLCPLFHISKKTVCLAHPIANVNSLSRRPQFISACLGLVDLEACLDIYSFATMPVGFTGHPLGSTSMSWYSPVSSNNWQQQQVLNP